MSSLNNILKLSSEENGFCTAINCMDGRTQLPVIYYLQNTYNIAFVDTITEPCPVKIISDNKDEILINSLKTRVNISIENHKSKSLSIIAHYDCAGNPVSDETQIEQIKKSVDIIKKWYENIPIIGLWVNRDWKVEKIIEK